MNLRALAVPSILVFLALAFGQDRLPSMPGYGRYVEVGPQIGRSVVRGDLAVNWIEGGKAFTFFRGGKTWRYDVAKRQAEEFEPAGFEGGGEPGRPRRQRAWPGRGRQYDRAISEDGKKLALHKSSNVFIADADGSNEIQVTSDGSALSRIKYGAADWMYGEELDQSEAMGWSPDGSKLWFYRFDQRQVPDYFLTVRNLNTQNALNVEPYPKAGGANPIVDLFVYDLASKKTSQVPVRESGAGPDGMGCYVYAIRWSPFDDSLLFHRMNRLQNEMEFCAWSPSAGTVRTIVKEAWPTGWIDPEPARTYLDEHPDIDKAPGYRGFAVWTTHRSGFRNLGLLNLRTGELKPLTNHKFDVGGVVRIDLAAKRLFYTARSGAFPNLLQLHRIGLDGKGEARITDPALSHRVSVSPDGSRFVDVAEAIDVPPETRLLDEKGRVLEVLAKSNLEKFEQLELRRTERIEFLAADGKTKLYGRLNFPSQFDPSRKYPLLVSVYAGPDSGGDIERFDLPDRICELGFLVATFDSRGCNGRGKAVQDAVYRRLGIVEIDDQAAGVRHLSARPYVDSTRVGVFGTSYGGYAAAMCLLRYPDVFHAAMAASSVTDWRNYDTIYAERYMGTPQLNPEGYENGSCMKYAGNLRGRLLLFYGTQDDNVHPSNTYQLVRALRRQGKSFEVQIGPDEGHSGLGTERMMEFFIERLVLCP